MTKMNELQNDYLIFIDSLLSNMDDETFLKKYEAVKQAASFQKKAVSYLGTYRLPETNAS